MQRNREVEVMHGPPTLASPTGHTPPGPRRGPLFFVALIVLLLLAIAAGALVVLVLFVKRAEPSAGPDASTSVTPLHASADRLPDAAPATETSITVAPHSAPAVHTPAPKAAASARGCLCFPNKPPTGSLCQTSGIAHCKCEAANSATLCPTPWSAAGCPGESSYGATATAKNGDPCSGHNADTDLQGKYINERLDGHLVSCYPCADVETYSGKIGAPCTGFRGDRIAAAGTIDCHNLEVGCSRGETADCAALAAHK